MISGGCGDDDGVDIVPVEEGLQRRTAGRSGGELLAEGFGGGGDGVVDGLDGGAGIAGEELAVVQSHATAAQEGKPDDRCRHDRLPVGGGNGNSPLRRGVCRGLSRELTGAIWRALRVWDRST